MQKEIVIKYDVVTGELKVSANDFTTFEVLGILEGAKAMIVNNWYEEDDE